MLKLILLLVAVAALAATAASTSPDFNDLDDSDLDDIDANDLLDDSFPNEEDALSDQSAVAADEVKATSCANSGVQCKNDQYINDSNGEQCVDCPKGQVLPYGDFAACGSGLCYDCPFQVFTSSKICVTSYQKQIIKQVVPLANGVVDMSPKTGLEANVADYIVPFTRVLDGQIVREKAATVLAHADSVAEAVQLQVASCSSGLTCCLPGFYGASSASCTACPSNKPSSPFSAPNSNCQCPNSVSTSCFACTNKCRPYDSQSRMCVPYQCPSGQTCKVQSGQATCV